DCGVANLSFSPDGRTLASGFGTDGTIDLWDVKTGQRLRSLTGAPSCYSSSSLSFSPDGRSLAASCSDGESSLWNVSTGKPILVLTEADGITFFPDGRILTFSSTSDDKTGIWSTEILEESTGKRLPPLKGHEDSLNSIVFYPSGRLLASNSMNKTITIWDVKTGKRIHTLKEKNIASESIIAFSPDGKTLAFTTDDNAIGIWNLQPTANEFSGISLDENGEYKIDLETLPYKLEGLELVPVEQKQTGPDKPARWSRYHPFHWLPAAEKGNSNAMLQIGIIYDRNNDIARALRWYGKAIKVGNEQAMKQQDILLHWLEDQGNWQTVPGPFRTAFCTTKAEFELPEKVTMHCN
ncbi:MAG: hypothetical protein D3910_06385, partial [Candidatus Electrothrix sp. ATG2]|nr:hypothetical protein [Candidatus Electrothrix sp. ATG2]